MRIATWNINSVRLRLPLLQRLMQERTPDVIALQETKTPDEFFPFDAVRAAGYPHIHIHGMKGYNGVAILSKIPFEAQDIHHRCGREDCRHMAVRLGGVELHNLYIPAGGDEPDPDINDKFAHKLAFVEEMAQWFKTHATPDRKLIAVGDFNIAPYEHDVWSHKQLLKVVSHTPPETTRLAAMRESLNWIDTARYFVPMAEKCYTWWSYRNKDWEKSNRGRRLDHIWVTPPLKSALARHEILTEARNWPQPSDHVPVILDLNL
ncbi:MAG: exodeoxyribonuclease III [Alphaproteobacteria bacterium]|nr:exodeoxyribonuclease III [Alphaproteobacteria bacterium]